MPGSRPPEYATKEDLAALRGEFAELRAEFHELRAEFRVLRETMRADFADMRSELLREVSALKTTLITTLIAMTAIFGGLVTVLKLFG